MNPPLDDPAWNRFQTAWLNALREHDQAEAIQSAMTPHAETETMREWLAGMDPDMLEIAAVLVKKWGQTDG